MKYEKHSLHVFIPNERELPHYAQCSAAQTTTYFKICQLHPYEVS